MGLGIPSAQTEVAVQRIAVGGKTQGIGQQRMAGLVRVEQGGKQLVEIDGRGVGDDHFARRVLSVLHAHLGHTVKDIAELAIA